MKKLLMLAAMLAMVTLLAAPVIAHDRFDGDGFFADEKDFDEKDFFDLFDDEEEFFDFFGLDEDDFDGDGFKDTDFDNGFDEQGPVSLEFGDQEVESGDIQTETVIGIEGNNNNQCVGLLQFGNTGNFVNQQGSLQYGSEVDDIEFSAGEFEFAPTNQTACEQSVEQAAAASSFGG